MVKGGEITFRVEPKDGEPYMKTIHLTRAHLEEDAGKSNHGVQPHKSGIDLNRAGTPLLEIVTEPELRSSAEAVGYAKALHALVVWLGISRGNMQEGNFRCDANVSVRPVGETKFGTRCEIKNLNLVQVPAGSHRLRSAPSDRSDRRRRQDRSGYASL